MDLADTTIISSDLQQTYPIWRWLKAEYQLEQNDSLDRAAISIINSILTQKLKYFAISKNGIWKLMSQDGEHKQPIKLFSGRMYPKLLQILYEKGFIQKVFKGVTQFKSDGYVVIDSDMLEYLDLMDIEEDKQYETLKVFCTYRGTSRGTKQESKIDKRASKQDRVLQILNSNLHVYSKRDQLKILSEQSPELIPVIIQAFKSLLEQAETGTQVDNIEQTIVTLTAGSMRTT